MHFDAISGVARVRSIRDHLRTAFEAMLMRVGDDEFNITKLFLSKAS